MKKEKLKIIEKGNTIKSLAIETEDGLKICSGISPKNIEYAKLFCEAPRMFELLIECYPYLPYAGDLRDEVERLELKLGDGK